MWERITGGYERDEDRVNELWGVEGGVEVVVMVMVVRGVLRFEFQRYF